MRKYRKKKEELTHLCKLVQPLVWSSLPLIWAELGWSQGWLPPSRAPACPAETCLQKFTIFTKTTAFKKGKLTFTKSFLDPEFNIYILIFGSPENKQKKIIFILLFFSPRLSNKVSVSVSRNSIGGKISATFWYGICITLFSPTVAFLLARVWTFLDPRRKEN